jgi:hypothetical protein
MAIPVAVHELRSAANAFASLASRSPSNTILSPHLFLVRRRDIDFPNITSATPAVVEGIIAETRTFGILAFWSPDIGSIVFCYAFAALLKGTLELMLRPRAVERAWAGARDMEGKGGIEVADAKARLSVPAKAACVCPLFDTARRLTRLERHRLSHFFNLFLSTYGCSSVSISDAR